MKKIKMFMMERCPYCKQAQSFMDELFAENPAYKSLEIEKIDELIHPDIADQYDYNLVPTYYIGDEKVHEGASSLDAIRRVFDTAMG